MRIPPAWKVKHLDEVVTLQRGFDLPHASRVPGTVPVISAGKSEGTHDRAAVTGPGFAIGRATNLGRPTWSEVDFWPLNTTLYAKDFKGNNPRFLFHLFESLDLSGFDSGSVQPMLNRNYISRVKVLVPPQSEQRAIAEVLGALGDKIAANSKLTATLGELRAALVQQISNLGETITIGAVAEVLTRGRAPKYTEDETAPLVVNQKCVRSGTVLLEQARKTTVPADRDRSLSFGDVLVNSTGMGTLGRVGIWTHREIATIDSHITLLRFPPAAHPLCLAQLLVLAESRIEALGEGSTGQTELGRELLRSFELPGFDRGQAARVEADLKQMHLLERSLGDESATLAKLRDTLLPALMDGTIRVKDAVAQAEGVL